MQRIINQNEQRSNHILFRPRNTIPLNNSWNINRQQIEKQCIFDQIDLKPKKGLKALPTNTDGALIFKLLAVN